MVQAGGNWASLWGRAAERVAKTCPAGIWGGEQSRPTGPASFTAQRTSLGHVTALRAPGCPEHLAPRKKPLWQSLVTSPDDQALPGKLAFSWVTCFLQPLTVQKCLGGESGNRPGREVGGSLYCPDPASVAAASNRRGRLGQPSACSLPRKPWGTGCVQDSRFLLRGCVRASPSAGSPRVCGSEVGGRQTHLDVRSSKRHETQGWVKEGCSIP